MTPLCEAGHVLVKENVVMVGRRPRPVCRRCKLLADYRRSAVRLGYPLCPEGHGLIYGGVSPEGLCTECNPGNRPPPPRWLDWAAVYNALLGRPLARALTNNELVCALATVIHRLECGYFEAADWIRDNTRIPVPNDKFQHLWGVWTVRAGVEPITVYRALSYENEPDRELAIIANELEEPDDTDLAA